jgi:hypothetical protein
VLTYGQNNASYKPQSQVEEQDNAKTNGNEEPPKTLKNTSQIQGEEDTVTLHIDNIQG